MSTGAKGIGGRDSVVCNGMYGGKIIIGPWPQNCVGITANGETVIITKEDFDQIVEWLKSWGYN